MARKSITFAEKQDEWLKFVVQQGHYKDESDYVRDLVRRDEQKNRDFLMTKAAIQEGLDSGFSTRSLDDIWSQAEKEYTDQKNG
ncbi:type II toxin-antitoxin system ParD family antitoxin [Pricia sp.]|uniref:type II toxin-antitoxin system ParD family antitoxin n=1 Tax=Pricia sp. TaxID=2268138 RepID=UPI0035941938